MRCYWISVLLFAAVGLAHTVGYWTLHNFQLFCDDEGATCAYHFSISQDEGATSGNQCLFTVDSQDGKPANQTDFQALTCLGNDRYKINGGWSQEGFVTIVVTDVLEALYAFFAYSSDHLEEGKTVAEQTRLAYKVGTFDVTSDIVAPVKRSGVEWQILNLNQEYDEVTGNTELTFAIQDTRGSMSPCTIIARGVEGSGPAVGSFYNEKCLESNWFVSWDYSALSDSAAMTLIEPSAMMKAWFQWENVRSTHSLGNSVRTLASPYEDEMLR
ncbi:hypothetical protein CONLIGDRAFT_680579 [Coniochaeta ligniaria NRRL 30616]|uniref:Uncharacterized protein n=1 Tax=Coniochaeta ligniaria NRRL 30616 TaxID=1408157 RepID=A0A1J7IQZ6_9PEZI|nr:hypothetical protein CONLIGDRAFT_680579 [Coniochaeta ligniaria NRRL 30616]